MVALVVRQVVDLVGHQQDRSIRLVEQLGETFVQWVDARFAVDEEEDDLRLVDRDERLFPDRQVQRLVASLDHTPRVDEEEVPSRPMRAREIAVPRHARSIVDDRDAASDHSVEERRLADVGPPDHGHHGEPAAHEARKAWVTS